ncbi:hypothetical protein AGDE_06990 [Angomonas deanei]|nr:hypothetical protein AGDE_06990 [Angomonas deanei]|eukprot:EPY36284.1 hypothetical protein AGDE_06990 [Angomonas deanei]
MKKQSERLWKAAPLPPRFHTALESGDWLRALNVYQRHPYHAPPSDSYELLKSIMHSTGVGIGDVKERFSEKVRLSSILQRKAPEEVEWGVFWDALNQGDGKVISDALVGARVSTTTQQVAVAEACAILLKNAGESWEDKLVNDVPFATVTRSNLVHVALTEQRWDIAVDLLQQMRLTKSDLTTLWPLIQTLSWEKVLQIISACPKNSVPYDTALLHILSDGCSLQQLSEHLEHARVLGDVEVVAPLLSYAIEQRDWEYVRRCMDHLVDIGQVTPASRKAFDHLCQLHGPEVVCLKSYGTVAVRNVSGYGTFTER